MKITLIAAVASNYGIGLNGQLLWHLPADMAFFRQHTLHKTILMGRKTFESIGHPLKNRENIVLSRSKQDFPLVKTIQSVAELENYDQEIMVIGGEQIYRLFLPLAQRIILTEVDANLQADTFFPSFDKETYICCKAEEHLADENNQYKIIFKEYVKK